MERTFFWKKAVVLMVAMMLLCPFTAGAQSIFADVNGDDEANISDVTALIDYLLGGNGGASGTAVMSRGVISVKDYGAVGDGVTDDTPAMERAFAYAGEHKLAVYVPQGTYMIRRPLTLKSGMEIYGDGYNSIIKKTPAAWHKLTDAIATGVYNDDEDHTITLKVDGISGYHVGDHCFISFSNNPFEPSNTKARYCSYGEIAEINETPIVENGVEKYEVKFKSAFDSEKHGVVCNHPVGAVLSTSFPVLRSWAFKDECINVFIHDICLDGNRQTEGPTYNNVTYEPMEWANGCIHFDAYGVTKVNGISYNNHSYNHALVHCKIINSSYDGISDQGEGGLYVKDCLIENCAMHGVHMGTVFSGGLIMGNTMRGNTVRGAGVFFCQDVTDVVIQNNNISSFNHGCSDEEYSTVGKYNIIRNNTFGNITSYVFDFMKSTSKRHGGGLIITGNTITGLKNTLFSGNYLDDVIITNNTVKSVTTPPATLITSTGSNGLIIMGNQLSSGTTISEPVNTTNATNVVNVSNSWN